MAKKEINAMTFGSRDATKLPSRVCDCPCKRCDDQGHCGKAQTGCDALVRVPRR